jgi:hypothetical protein
MTENEIVKGKSNHTYHTQSRIFIELKTEEKKAVNLEGLLHRTQKVLCENSKLCNTFE